jgi:hypothetical protein
MLEAIMHRDSTYNGFAAPELHCPCVTGVCTCDQADAFGLTELGADVVYVEDPWYRNPTFRLVYGLAATASMAASVYHGYKRNDSLGWAIWWGLMGSLFPVFSVGVALAQGFGQPKRERY